MRIEPTIGRVVHLRTAGYPDDQPVAAIIVKLLGAPYIKVFDCSGICHREVPLMQEGDLMPAAGVYAVWMPFQKGQAQKTEELQRALAAQGPGPMVEVARDPGLTPPAFVGTLNEAVAGLKGPHISAADVNANIDSITYTTMPSGKSIVCELILKNGFTVRGESAVMRKENFKEEIGRELAYQDAWKKIWGYMAYNLAQNIYTVNVLNNPGGQPETLR